MTVRPALLAGTAPPAGAYDADIVILALDRAQETRAAIASALAQQGLTRHLIVLDQGSDPAARARFAAAVAARTDAALFAVPANLGVAGGRNLASALGHGRVIIGLDNDAEFATPATAAGLVAALAAEPDLAAIAPRILTGTGAADDLTSWGYPLALLARAGESFDTALFVGAGHAIRRAAWEAAGPYDARLFFCWEEYDFCLRAIAAGWRVRYRGDLAVCHKVAPGRRVAWSGARWFHYVRNRLLIERKWGASWPELLPRAGGYLLKGARAGLWRQGIAGIVAAARMDPGTDRRPLPAPARRYLFRVDRLHRGGLLTRLRREVLSKPGAALPEGRLRLL
ncbi:MAG: glycosyltransferase family 2 protein [Acetobacteraceae bacterium]